MSQKCATENKAHALADLSQRPHQRPVDPHELLRVDRIRFVENDPDFILVTLKCRKEKILVLNVSPARCQDEVERAKRPNIGGGGEGENVEVSCLPFTMSIAALNSSEMSNLFISKSKIIRSQRSANHLKQIACSTSCLIAKYIVAIKTNMSILIIRKCV